MDWRPRHHEDPIPRRPLWGSLAVHGAVGILALVFSLNRPEPLQFDSFEITMVQAPSPDRPVEDTPLPAEEIVVDTPEPEPVQPEPEPVQETPPPVVEQVREQPRRDPDPEPPVRETPPPPKPDPAPPAEEPVTNRAAEEDLENLTGEELNIRMQGLQREYPAYYQNIIRQLQRCFRPPGSRAQLATTIYFEIRPNGTTAAERLYERSGNSQMDFGALAAVADCAGREARFGPLPEDYPYERLPILFTFRTSGEG